MLRARRGFTLIEIAIVLVVVGIALGGALFGIAPVIQNSRISQTNQKMDRIELALLAYVMQNGCLPCPANGALGSTDTSGDAGWSRSDGDYYGPGNTASAAQNRPCAAPVATTGCETAAGAVPWNSLGLKDADTTDAWQDRITYRVTSGLTLTAGTSMARTPPSGYPAGDLAVRDNSGVIADCDDGTEQTGIAAYVLVSHGADRFNAYPAKNGGALITNPDYNSVAQDCNIPTGTGPFHLGELRLTEGTGYFDDIVRFRTAPSIVQDCGKNACGNPP